MHYTRAVGVSEPFDLQWLIWKVAIDAYFHQSVVTEFCRILSSLVQCGILFPACEQLRHNTMLSQHLILHCVQQFSSVLACFDATER